MVTKNVEVAQQLDDYWVTNIFVGDKRRGPGLLFKALVRTSRLRQGGGGRKEGLEPRAKVSHGAFKANRAKRVKLKVFV